MSEQLVNSPFLQTLAITLIHFLWQGVLVACLLKLSFTLISKSKAPLRYGAAMAAMLANLILPVITFIFYYQPTVAAISNPLNNLTVTGLPAHFENTITRAWYHQLADYLPYVSVAWLAAILGLAAKLLVEIYLVQRLPKSQIIATEPKLLAKFQQLVDQVGLKKAPKLLVSLKVDVPMAIGWLKPVVLMPAKMITGLSSEQLEMLLLHELAHIKRHDYLVNFFQTLIEILLFFHPAVLWVSKQMRQEREYCSDDIAVSHCGNPIAYAHTLADTAALCRHSRKATIPTMAMAASGGDLKQRVVRLVNHQCTSENHAGKWLAAVTISFFVLMFAAKQFAQIPQFLINDTGYSNLEHSSQLETQTLPAMKSEPLTTTIAEQLLNKPSNELTQEKSMLSSSSKQVNSLEDDFKSAERKTLETQVIKNALPKLSNKANQQVNTIQPLPVETLERKQTIAENIQPRQKQATRYDQQLAQLQQEMALDDENNKVQQAHNNLVQQSIEHSNDVAKKNTPKARALHGSNQNSLASIKSQDAAFDAIKEQQLVDSKVVNLEHERLDSLQKNNSNLLAKERVFNQIQAPAIKLNPTHSTSAELIEIVDPKYPSVAKRKGIEIDILVNFTVDKTGQVKNIQFEQKSKASYFRSAITAAMNKWRFLPAERNGQAIESSQSKIFSFNLN